jgi:predicted glycogen debranching enzyme
MQKSINDIMNHEYLMTNGLGGYSFGTLDQVNCRKYHGLYTVSYNPPIERMHLISKIAEAVVIEGATYPVTFENATDGSVPLNDATETHLKSYRHEGIIEQVFELSEIGVIIKRTLAMAYGTNHLAVRYQMETTRPVELVMTPLFNFRDHHDVVSVNLEDYHVRYDDPLQYLHVASKGKEVYLKWESATGLTPNYKPNHTVSAFSYYPIETQRGYPDIERHADLGAFHFSIDKGLSEVDLLINLSPTFESASSVFRGRQDRYEALIAKAGAKYAPYSFKRLIQAADDFIVYRKTTGKMTIIAGYPWFSDWGRDTMISIPGLTLETGRHEEALQMIEGFLSMAYMGIIPNNFPDEGEAPMYNTSDATLWLFNALYMYYEQTKDLKSIERLYPKLMEIINHHIQGTINEIYMDVDGLLSSGNEETQLTWMDVKVGGWVVTPRHGKAVEINALWYNAVAVMNEFSKRLNIPPEALERDFEILMKQIKQSFNDVFWNEKEHNLYDLIIDGKAVDIPRPNMIFAVSLPFAVLDERRWLPVVEYVMRNFKVPYGLLTLRREDEAFHERYEGDLLSRDGAYHRGTAWGWLIGPYLEAHYKTFGDTSYIRSSIDALMVHLDEGVHGSIAEIFEGGAPHAWRGCSAQAWSVAEAIRLYKMTF